MKPSELLIKAQAVIADPRRWTQDVYAKTPDQVLDGLDDGEWGSTPQIAVVRAYLVKTYGKEVDMPELELIP